MALPLWFLLWKNKLRNEVELIGTFEGTVSSLPNITLLPIYAADLFPIIHSLMLHCPSVTRADNDDYTLCSNDIGKKDRWL